MESIGEWKMLPNLHKNSGEIGVATFYTSTSSQEKTAQENSKGKQRYCLWRSEETNETSQVSESLPTIAEKIFFHRGDIQNDHGLLICGYAKEKSGIQVNSEMFWKMVDKLVTCMPQFPSSPD